MRLIAINPTLRAEAGRLLPTLERAKQPATPADILTVLIRQAPVYGVTAKSEGEWDALFDAYIRVLLPLPVQAIEEGFVRWGRGEGHSDIRMAGFFPKPGQIYILAEQAHRDLVMAHYRVKKALEHQENTPRQKMTDEERADMREKLRLLSASLGAQRSPVVAIPRSGGPHALAEALRARADPVGDVI